MSPVRAAALELARSFDPATRQDLGGIDLSPVVETLLESLVDLWQRKCRRQTAAEVREAMTTDRGEATIRRLAADAIREHYGTRRKIGRIAFGALRDEAARTLRTQLASTEDTRIDEVRQYVLTRQEG